MKFTMLLIALSMICCVAVSQNSEMDKFYAYYNITNSQKKPYDSVYGLIEQRRSALSKELKAFKEKNNNSADGFLFNWSEVEEEIIKSLGKISSKPMKHLIYYSYFDLGYGIYGLNLKTDIIKKAIKEISPASAIWAMEPSLLEAIIKATGGEDQNRAFIKSITSSNKDSNLVRYVRYTLSPERALKKGKYLPPIKYRNLADTMQVLSGDKLKGKYYLIDIWATWCKPCIEELPLLLNLHNKAAEFNLELISISIDNTPSIALKFLNEKVNLPWVQSIAVSRKELMNELMITGIPCTILINPDGNIISYGYELRGNKLENTIKELVVEK